MLKNIIHHNTLGVTLFWEKQTDKEIQFIFRDTGLLLRKEEIYKFAKRVKEAQKENLSCIDCTKSKNCRSIVVETPFVELNFVVSKHELNLLDDLIQGTIFKLGLNQILYNLNIEVN